MGERKRIAFLFEELRVSKIHLRVIRNGLYFVFLFFSSFSSLRNSLVTKALTESFNNERQNHLFDFRKFNSSRSVAVFRNETRT